jgi:5'(3')-deoxyribonucleotidase
MKEYFKFIPYNRVYYVENDSIITNDSLVKRSFKVLKFKSLL